ARLARAGTGEDQQRPLAVRDRLALGLVEALQQLLEMLGVGVGGHPDQHRCGCGWRDVVCGPRRARGRGRGAWTNPTRAAPGVGVTGPGGRVWPPRMARRSPLAYRFRMALLEDVRTGCAWIAVQAKAVRIDEGALAALAEHPELAAGGALQTPPLDPESHYLEGEPADVADYLLALDAINFGSGWFGLLRKRHEHGRALSGYFTVAWALADHVRAGHPLTGDWLCGVDTREIAAVLDQPPELELMSLYAQALRALGRFLGARRALDLVAQSRRSAERLAEALAGGMPMFGDRGFYKRAQIVAADLALAGLAEFDDLDRLTIFADNLVPHVLRCEGVLV